MTTRFKEGDRVRLVNAFGISTSCPRETFIRSGTLGTVALVAGFTGKSIYCDPSRRMVFVKWDNGADCGAFRGEIERVKA